MCCEPCSQDPILIHEQPLFSDERQSIAKKGEMMTGNIPYLEQMISFQLVLINLLILINLIQLIRI